MTSLWRTSRRTRELARAGVGCIDAVACRTAGKPVWRSSSLLALPLPPPVPVPLPQPAGVAPAGRAGTAAARDGRQAGRGAVHEPALGAAPGERAGARCSARQLILSAAEAPPTPHRTVMLLFSSAGVRRQAVRAAAAARRADQGADRADDAPHGAAARVGRVPGWACVGPAPALGDWPAIGGACPAPPAAHTACSSPAALRLLSTCRVQRTSGCGSRRSTRRASASWTRRSARSRPRCGAGAAAPAPHAVCALLHFGGMPALHACCCVAHHLTHSCPCTHRSPPRRRSACWSWSACRPRRRARAASWSATSCRSSSRRRALVAAGGGAMRGRRRRR